MRTFIHPFAVVVATLSLLLAACGSTPTPAAAAVKQYPMHGQIMGLDTAQHVATIKHDEIPGFMGAMTMGYPIKDPADFAKLSTGETINATVFMQGEEMWVGNIQKDASAH